MLLKTLEAQLILSGVSLKKIKDKKKEILHLSAYKHC